MPELIELQEYPVKDYLADLLKDKTTGKNMLFATDAYQVEKTEEMSVERLTQFEKYVIQPRVSKTISEQAERTRNKAEVFTPSWICQKMNDTYDEIIHSDEWQNYIQSTVLEITCGEAPYLVSRYDTATGETIPIEKRIGILDRKLKIVNEHTKTMKSWIEWTNKAFRSVYGYEFQGDSLLIARINLLMTFVEYYRDRWGCDPTENQLNTIVGIICRNLWQMDGLTRQIPFTENEEGFIGSFFDIDMQNEVSIFDIPDDPQSLECIIWDWNNSEAVIFNDIEKGLSEMKFDFVIGNPPYQEETTNVSLTNGQLRRKSIFHFFQNSADEIAKEGSILIYPGGRWIQRSGKGMADFGLKQINDPKLKTVYFYPDSSELFSSVAIADGISIVVKSTKKAEKGFQYIYCANGKEQSFHMENPGENIIPLNPNDISITKKIEEFVTQNKLMYLHERVFPQKLFGIESDFVEKNIASVREYTNDSDINFETEIKLYANDKAGKAGRTKWFVANQSIISANTKYINMWKVVVSSANAGGQKRNNQLEIIDNHSAFGRSRVALGIFEDKKEAENFYHYIQSYIIRYAFLMTDEALTTLALKVPDIGSYSSENKIIDFSKDIDEQFVKLLNLTDSEFEYIKNRIDSLRPKEIK